MKKKIKYVFKVLSSAVFVILLAIMAFMLVYVVRVKLFANNDKLGDVNVNFFTILSPSMYPAIKPGDIIITYKNDDNKYVPGDVITFASDSSSTGGVTITHRVVSVFDVNGINSYTTKGDNNPSEDSTKVPEDKILGRVIFKIPKAGYIQQFLVTKTGWITIILIPCLGVVIYDILKVFKITGKNSKFRKKDIVVDTVAEEKLKEIINESNQQQVDETVVNNTVNDIYKLPEKVDINPNVDSLSPVQNQEVQIIEVLKDEEEEEIL